jgi:uncharacterized lipoprotein NlpE involved in copper resistance
MVCFRYIIVCTLHKCDNKDDNNNSQVVHTYTHTHYYVNMKISLLSNQGVHSDREVMTNRSDIIIKNKEGKMCLLTDVVIPADRNVIQKEAEKKLKYNSLCTERQ